MWAGRQRDVSHTCIQKAVHPIPGAPFLPTSQYACAHSPIPSLNTRLIGARFCIHICLPFIGRKQSLVNRNAQCSKIQTVITKVGVREGQALRSKIPSRRRPSRNIKLWAAAVGVIVVRHIVFDTQDEVRRLPAVIKCRLPPSVAPEPLPLHTELGNSPYSGKVRESPDLFRSVSFNS